MKRKPRRAGPAKAWEFEDYSERKGRSLLAEYGPMVVGGVLLVLAFAFAGHYMGQNAVAHNAEPDDVLESFSGPSSNILAKGSLVADATSLETVNKTSFSSQVAYDAQTVITGGKGDLVMQKQAPAQQKIRIVPASVDLTGESDQVRARVVLAPSPTQIEQVIKLKRSASVKKVKDKDTQKAIAMRRVQLAEENCLARAVYFEARSESELGQLAVAKVILNRVKNPEYPKSICGVVYQGSGRRNSCQFSFACDGLPDDVKSAAAWANAKRIAQKAIGGDAKVAAVGSATNYHADYVRPAWAKSMKRLIKIGHHVFYEDS
ncbi:cell wall hydrolase [Aestuariivirga sp.]|uniref:cell wall hydrolase n=1 Tax=Aestuariivirga sp. TaxID=2650926 RepID=UPI003BA98BFE